LRERSAAGFTHDLTAGVVLISENLQHKITANAEGVR